MIKSFPILTPLLLLALLACTIGDAVLPQTDGWRAQGLFPAQSGELWRLFTYPYFLGEPGQAVLTFLTLALVAPGLEEQRGGWLLLLARWLLAGLAIGLCQKAGPPLLITGSTLIAATFLVECMLSGYLQSQPSPWKTWWALLACNLVSAFLQGWIIPTLFLSLFLGAAFTVGSQRWVDRAGAKA